LVRLFEQPAAVRLGLPASLADEQRLAQALAAYQKETA
nr:threonine-phosphate decarboxylase [Gammaproteobacteria bacterium]